MRRAGSAILRYMTCITVLTTIAAACGQVGVPANLVERKLEQSKFDAVHRAGRTARENIGQGVSLLKFRELVALYATEVSIARDHAQTPLENEFVTFHEAALKAARDSLTIWDEKIKQSPGQSGQSVSANVSQTSVGLEKIADEYSVSPKFGGTKPGGLYIYEADPLIQKIWSRVLAKLNAADAIYRGESVTASK